MKFFQNLSIAVKILIPPAVLILALVVVSLSALYGLNFQRETLSEINDIALDKITLVDEFIALSEQVQSDVFRISVLRFMDLPEEEIQPVQVRMEQGLNDLNVIYGQILREWSLDEEEQATVGRMKEPLDAFRQQARQAVTVASDNPSFAVILVRAATVPFDEFRSALTDFLDYQQAKIIRAEAEAARRATTVSTVILALALGITLVGMVATVLISNRLIAQPIRSMTDLMGRLADGDLSIKVAGLQRQDEIGGMGQAVEVFRRNAIEKARAEEALRESEEKLRNIVENSTNLFYAHTTEHVLTYLSPQVEELLGYEPAEAMVRWTELATDHPLNLRGFEITQTAIDTGERQQPYELELRHKQGHAVWVEVREAPVVVDGKTVAMVGALTDITERKRAEEGLRRRAEELAALQATVLEITAPHDLPTLLQTVVERATRLLNARGGGIYLSDPDRREARCVVSYNTPHDYTGTILKYGEGAAGIVVQTGEPLIIDDYRVWSQRAPIYDEEQPFTAVLSVPMIWQDLPTGVIHVLDDGENRRFTEADLALLTLFANHAAIAVENMRLYEAAQNEIAERKRAEEALRQSKSLLDTTGRMARVGGWELDAETFEVRWTEETYRIHEVPLDYKPSLQEAIDFFHPADRERLSRAIQRALEQGEPYDMELQFITAKGNRLWTRTICHPQIVNDKTIRLLGTFQDITDRKRAEEEIAGLARFPSENPNPVLRIAKDGTIVYANTACLPLLNAWECQQDQPLPDDWQKITSDVLSSGLDRVVEIEVEDRMLSLTLTPVVDTGYVNMYGLDITERQRAEEALKAYSERLEEMVDERTGELQAAQEQLVRREKLAVLGQLAGGVAHELRSPLGVISGAAYYLDMLLAEREPDSDMEEAVNLLKGGVETSERVIGSLLDFARTQPPVRLEIDLNDVVRETLSHTPLPDTPRVEVVLQLDEHLPPILADPSQLFQVLGNIIRNGIQAMPDGGHLVIKSACRGGPGGRPEWVTVSVGDSGEGISGENLNKIFEPLFTTKAKGIGLGLAIVKMLVEEHGGTIGVESRVGEGSTFTVRLPLDASTAVEGEEA